MAIVSTAFSVMYALPLGNFARREFECREREARPYGAGVDASVGAGVDIIPDPSRHYPVEDAFLQADRVALSLRGALERTTLPLARTSAALVAAEAWCDFGFARLDDYARERLGRSGRWVRDLAALGERLRSLPALAAAITGQDGGRPVGRVAAMLIAKVASPASLDGWIALARASSVRALRDAVRAARSAPMETPRAPETRETRETRETPTEAPAAAPPDAASPPNPAAPGDDADDDATDRLLVRMMVPTPVLVAFDEAVDLFRAVEGGEATVASFVEALIAEAAARGARNAGGTGDAGCDGDAGGADADARSLRAGPAIAALERALAASTGHWRHLPEHAESSWALSLAGVTLARFGALADEAGRGDPGDLDRQLRALVEIENEIEARLGAILADLGDRRAWPRLRFAGVGHYGEERLGLARTAAEDRARLARDLRRYPRLREAYAAGVVGREAAALVVRLLRDASADSARDPAGEAAREAAWVERAAESTVKRMRDEARALGRYRVLGPRVGAPPDIGGPLDPGVSLDPGGPLDDAAWHSSLRREPGQARRRVRLFGRLTLTGPDVFQAIPHESDSFLRLRLPLELGGQFLAAVDAECHRLAAAADALPWDAGVDGPEASATHASADSPDLPASWLAARMFSIRCRRVPAWVGLLALIEDFVDTWDDDRGMPRRPGDEIYVRDGWRCAAPGCTSRRNLEDHHLRYRSRGGDDDPANRICLCRFHHQRGEHGGLASCRGLAPVGVVWRLGRQGNSGQGASAQAASAWYRNERRIAGGPPG